MGFDIECIPNIQWLPREYFCLVCGLLVHPNEALQPMCAHLYCDPCLAYVANTTRTCPFDGYLVTTTDAKPLVESNKVLADTIGSIVVQCLYQKNGCTWLGSLSESSSHCSECAFGSTLIVCNNCGFQIPHRQTHEHLQVCPGLQQVHVQQSQGFQPVAASNLVQANTAQGQAVAAATPTQEQIHQQQYQQYYQNYYGYDKHQQQALMSNPQQQLYFPGQALQTASQQQVLYMHPAVQYVAQTLSQVQPQPQLQSQHLPYALFPEDPSQPLLASQSPQDLQTQTHSRTTPFSQAHHLQNPQVSQDQQFDEQIRSQLHIQDPSRSQLDNTAQNSQLQTATGQGQSHQPHAHWTGQRNYPKPNQINQVGVPPDNMNVYHHQFETQHPQVHDHLSQQVSYVHPPTIQGQQPSVPSQLTGTQSTKQLLRQYGGVSVSESSVVPLSKRSIPQQPMTAPTTAVVHNQVLEENVGNGLKPRGKSHVVEKNGSKDAPSLYGSTSLKVADKPGQMSGTLNKDKKPCQIQVSRGFRCGEDPPLVKHGHLSFPTRFGNPSEDVPLGVQGQMHAPKYQPSHGTESSSRTPRPAAMLRDERSTPIQDEWLNHASVKPSGLKYLDGGLKHVLESGTYFSRSLDRGFGPGIPLKHNEEHEPDHDSRPPSRVLSQIFIDLDDYPDEMPSHGYNSTNDIEGNYRFGEDFEGHGNLQMGEKVPVSDSDVPNHLRGGESLPGDKGTFQNSESRATRAGAWCSICKLECESTEALKMHFQTKEHQKKSMDMVSMIKPNATTPNNAPAECSSFNNPNKMRKTYSEADDDRKKKSITHPEDRGSIT